MKINTPLVRSQRGQVQLAVAVEVGHEEAVGAGIEVGAVWSYIRAAHGEGSVTIAQEDGHFAGVPRGIDTPNRNIEHVVAIEVAHGYGINTLLADRKSTRLNSSHANISYAVFCLKKK